jgi:hypothetical protein
MTKSKQKLEDLTLAKTKTILTGSFVYMAFLLRISQCDSKRWLELKKKATILLP